MINIRPQNETSNCRRAAAGSRAKELRNSTPLVHFRFRPLANSYRARASLAGRTHARRRFGAPIRRHGARAIDAAGFIVWPLGRKLPPAAGDKFWLQVQVRVESR